MAAIGLAVYDPWRPATRWGLVLLSLRAPRGGKCGDTLTGLARALWEGLAGATGRPPWRWPRHLSQGCWATSFGIVNIYLPIFLNALNGWRCAVDHHAAAAAGTA